MNKRLFDITLSLACIFILSPLFLILALFIWMGDRGEILFCQSRIGLNGRQFTIFKFRTMTESTSINPVSFEPGDSSRITTLGRYLRKTKLDELPQLFNVLRGEMSMVGPRPEVEEWVLVYPERWEKVLSVRPGMTDNAAIMFSEEEQLLAGAADPIALYRNQILPQKLDLYEEYVDSHTMGKDLGILFKTLFTIIKRKDRT